MAHKILLIGKDRVRSGRISAFLESSKQQVYSVQVKRTPLAFEKVICELNPSLVLVHFEKSDKTMAVIQKVRDAFPEMPVAAVIKAVHPLPIQLIELDH
jgi:hypothetical protein